MTSFLSLACVQFPQHLGIVFKARAVGTAGGFSVGLAISLAAYKLVGYVGLFAALSAFILGVVFLLFLFDKAPLNDLTVSSGRQKSLGYIKVLSIRRVWITLLNNQISGMIILFAEPTLALKLSSNFGFKQDTISLYVLSYAIFAGVGALLALCIPEKVEKRNMVVAGNVILVVSQILVGPSALLRLPNNPSLIAIGLGLGGLSKSIIIAFTLPDAVAGGVAVYRDHPG